MEELGEYSANRNDIKSYIKNKVFKNFLTSKQSSTAPKVTKPKSSRKGGKKYKTTRKYKKIKKVKKSKKSKKYN